MNRPIKFRGKRLDNHLPDTGEMVYGDLIRLTTATCIYSAREILFDANDVYEVEPESVAQLVGYDKDGAEVYEGDTVCDKHGINYVVRLIPQVPVAKMTVKEAKT